MALALKNGEHTIIVLCRGLSLPGHRINGEGQKKWYRWRYACDEDKWTGVSLTGRGHCHIGKPVYRTLYSDSYIF